MPRALIFGLLLYLLALASTVAGFDWSKLNNADGQDPCCITRQLISSCNTNISQSCLETLDGSTVQPGSNCTCNSVVLTTWTACLSSNNSINLPSGKAWKAACEPNITFTLNAYPLATTVQIPSWAFRMLDSDGNVDMSGIMQSVSGWTPAQIAIPIIIAVSLFLIFGLILFLYWKRVRRRSGQPSTISDAWNSLTRAPRRWLGLKPKHLPPKDRYLHSRSSSVADIRVESATPLQFSRTHSLEREEHVEEQVGLLNRPPPLNSASFMPNRYNNISRVPSPITFNQDIYAAANPDSPNHGPFPVEIRVSNEDVDKESLPPSPIEHDEVPYEPPTPRRSPVAAVPAYIRPSRADPTLLFSPAVRAAGYTGVPPPAGSSANLHDSGNGIPLQELGYQYHN